MLVEKGNEGEGDQKDDSLLEKDALNSSETKLSVKDTDSEPNGLHVSIEEKTNLEPYTGNGNICMNKEFLKTSVSYSRKYINRLFNFTLVS